MMRSQFYIKRRKLRYSGNWVEVSCGRDTAMKLYRAVAAEFGPAVGRKVCNICCLAPFEMRPIYEVGTLDRMSRLADVISTVGEFVPGLGFIKLAAGLACEAFPVAAE